MRIKIEPRKSKRITVKAPGYKSKTLTVSSRDTRVSVALEKESATPPQLDCRNSVVDPSSAACIRQYCKTHSAAIECTE